MGTYSHASSACAGEMRFSVYRPPQAQAGAVPVLTYLAGLTCTEETFMIKAGAQRLAAEAGLMLVAPDTSPRGAGLEGEDEDWDFGTGAGFYLGRHRRAVGGALQHVHLPHRRAPRRDRRRVSRPRGRRRHLRPLHGRPRRAHPRAQEPRRLPLGLGLRPHRRADAGAVGEEGVRRLPRPRARGLARLRRHRAGRKHALSTAPSSSTRARPTRSSPNSSDPSSSRPRAPPPASR